jgi:hypothetical protein
MLEGARRTPADLAAFVELHIEQVGWQGGLARVCLGLLRAVL